MSGEISVLIKVQNAEEDKEDKEMFSHVGRRMLTCTSSVIARELFDTKKKFKSRKRIGEEQHAVTEKRYTYACS